MRQASGLEERGHLYETLPFEQREELLQWHRAGERR